MRLWTLHPKYLDARGLVALWREALLGQKVLRGQTCGYKHHPQLIRFAETQNPPAALVGILKLFMKKPWNAITNLTPQKLESGRSGGKITETRDQLLYEWRHLKRKLKKRDHEPAPRNWRR